MHPDPITWMKAASIAICAGPASRISFAGTTAVVLPTSTGNRSTPTSWIKPKRRACPARQSRSEMTGASAGATERLPHESLGLQPENEVLAPRMHVIRRDAVLSLAQTDAV